MGALVAVPALALTMLGMARDTRNLMDPTQGFVGLMSLVLILAAVVLNVYMLGALLVMTARELDMRPKGWTDSWSYLYDRRLFWPVALALLIYAGAVLGGVVLLAVPGIYFGVVFMLVVPALVLGNRGGRDALAASKRIIKPHLFRGGLDFAALLFIPWAAVIVVQAVFIIKFGLTSTAPIRVVPPAVFTYLVAALWTPVDWAARSLLYIENTDGVDALGQELLASNRTRVQ